MAGHSHHAPAFAGAHDGHGAVSGSVAVSRTQVPHREHAPHVSISGVLKWGALTAGIFLAVIIVVVIYFNRYKTQMNAGTLERVGLIENTQNNGPWMTYQNRANAEYGVDNETQKVQSGGRIDSAMRRTIERYAGKR